MIFIKKKKIDLSQNYEQNKLCTRSKMSIFYDNNAVLFWKCEVERNFEKSISNISKYFVRFDKMFFDLFKIFVSYYFDNNL